MRKSPYCTAAIRAGLASIARRTEPQNVDEFRAITWVLSCAAHRMRTKCRPRSTHEASMSLAPPADVSPVSR